LKPNAIGLAGSPVSSAQAVRGDANVAQTPTANQATRKLIRRELQVRGRSQTRKNVLNLLRVALQEALDRELIGSNPARDVRLHAATRMMAEDDLDGILNPAE
jgi:hypothetical protein